MSSLLGSRGPTGRGIAGHKTGSLQQYTPEQMNLFRSLFSNVSPDSYLSRLAGGDEALLSQQEQPALRQFSQLQGNLASRFGGQGGMGGRRSSTFQNTMNAQASDFAQDLQGRRMELQRQALRDLMDISGSLLEKRPYQQYQYEPQQPFWQKILGGSLPLVGGGLGALLGGPAGAAIGGRLGSAAGQAFF
jgi:hypothetical protein